MHPFSLLTLGIFVAGDITARWDLVTRLYELAIFAWDHGVVVSVFLKYVFKHSGLIRCFIGTCCQRLCDIVDLLLSDHNTSGKTGIEGDEFGICICKLVMIFR